MRHIKCMAAKGMIAGAMAVAVAAMVWGCSAGKTEQDPGTGMESQAGMDCDGQAVARPDSRLHPDRAVRRTMWTISTMP